MTLHRLTRASALAAAACLSACGGSGTDAPPHAAAAASAAAELDQRRLCEVRDWRDSAHCQPGQKVVFLPRSFGNAQLPVIFAAVACDLRYSVALTEGAVTCIYQPIRPAEDEAAQPPASAPASAASAP